MTDDEFQGKVLGQLAAIVLRLDERVSEHLRLSQGVERLSDRFERRLDAVVARLDEQDNASDALGHKVDRLSLKVDSLSVEVRNLAAATEQALNSVTALSRRVTRLEHPQGGN